MTGEDLRRIVEKHAAERKERIRREFFGEVAKHVTPEVERVLTHDIVACKCGQKNRVPVLIPEGRRPICGRCKEPI